MSEIKEITVEEAAKLYKEGAVIIDVREKDEYEKIRVKDAKLIPLRTLGESLSKIPSDKTVLVICQGGGRSAKACEILQTHGVEAINIKGGTAAWVDAGLPAESSS